MKVNLYRYIPYIIIFKDGSNVEINEKSITNSSEWSFPVPIIYGPGG